tara:strand:- start:231 stop:1586 length:1356 start_codon:yes stop_codon:yes gene_type:complete
MEKEMTTVVNQVQITRSLEIYDRAKKLIPGISQLISRRPTRAAFGISPIYAERAKGCKIWDVDGNEYIDWGSAVGPIILGYANPVVDAAVIEAIDKGSIYSIIHENSVELAELLVEIVPSAEMVRYCKGGGEACTVAVRIARGATGRDKVLFCGYHGWHDWYQAANLGHEKLQEHLFSGIEPIGVPASLEGTAIPFEYGDLDMLEDLLKEHDNEVACIIMEPMRSEIPPPGYLEGVRDLATRYGVVLVFDEVSCGWRIALGGVQEYTGVTPDLTAFAKAISNGYPMGAVVGKREFMEPAENMFISSAYWDDNVGISASIATLRELKRLNSPAHFERVGEELKQRINKAADDAGLDAQCVGISAHPGVRFNVDDAELAKKVSTLFVQENARRRLILATGFFFNMAHDEEALARTEAGVRETFEVIAEGLRDNAVDRLLAAEIQEDSFRRLVR